MNTRQQSRWRTVVTAYPCEVCGAGPGDPCITNTRNRKAEPHADRARLASANAWRNPDEDAYIGPDGSPLPRNSR